jgi:rod shape-determining protein MreD
MNIAKNILRFVVLLILQVLLFNHLNGWGLCHPYIYIICLLMMPITLPIWAEMIIGALAGLVMDIFCNTMGVHMAACVLLMYLRRIFIPRLVFEPERLNDTIDSNSLGIEAFLKYSIVLTIIHHTTVQLLSAWSFSHIWWTILSSIVSSLVSLVLIFIYDRLRTQK